MATPNRHILGYKEKKCGFCGKSFVIINGKQKYCKKCCPTKKHRDLLFIYGLSLEQYKELLQKYNGICPLCGEKRPLCIDHDHKTGKVRGMLCKVCNMVLGRLGDNSQEFEKNIMKFKKYLKNAI
jgi:hypothetical protein